MKLIVTANYPKNIVRDLVKFAEDFVFKNASFKLPKDFPVRVKNSIHPYAGMFYGNRITIRIGKPKQYPVNCKYPRRVNAPEYVLNDWKEGIVSVAMHEFWHYYQMKTSSPYSENEAERRNVVGLELFRNKRSELESKWKHDDEKKMLKQKMIQERAKYKKSPEYELSLISKKIASFQRKLKLYTTKLKKLQRRQKFLQKRISVDSLIKSNEINHNSEKKHELNSILV